MTYGVNNWSIRKARETDLENIKRLADRHRQELGFVRRPALLASIKRDEIFVAENGENLIGFVEYHHRRDEQTTLYNIVVNPEFHQKGIGRQLVQALIDESRLIKKQIILLKCPQDLESNNFYQAMNFFLHSTEDGKHRPLNVWGLNM